MSHQFFYCKILLDRLRHRQNDTVQKVDMIDITDEKAKMIPKFIEEIDLTSDHPPSANVDPERMADFRRRVLLAFQKGKKQLMSLLNLARRVNHENKEKFSKREIESALLHMVDLDEIWISNGLVRLI